MQPKALQSLKKALQPAVSGVALSWDLPPGMEAALMGPAPEVIFSGQRCLVYAQLRGQPQPPGAAVGGVTLQYRIQEQSYKETLPFPLQPQAGDSIPQRLWGRPQHNGSKSSDPGALPEPAPQKDQATEESPLLRLVSLQNADGSWDFGPQLVVALGVSETDARGRMPSEDVVPGVWATVLAVVWLHGRAAGQRDEWELLEAKAVVWVQDRAGPWLSECLEAANALLGCSVGPAVFGL
nr:von Willebrand factor A domain-containing protein 5A-like [Pelodiscus sinensis]|eukprot:XP_025035960.1 von Willebrand factor A domain-containing protein 5A-like [Pelodiscus sinensis]